MRRNIAAMVGVAVLSTTPVFAAGPGVNHNAILHALAPIDGQVEAGADLPSVNLEDAFAVNSAVLEPAAVRQLDDPGVAFRSPALAGFRFEIGGDTDATGGAAHNRTLSLRRAMAVSDLSITTASIRHGWMWWVGAQSGRTIPPTRHRASTAASR